MKDYTIFKEKACQMRHNNMSLDEISKTLNLSKTTIYYWIKDIEAKITRRPCTEAASKKNRQNWADRRQKAYNDGVKEYQTLKHSTNFRDFVILYICEGYKRNRNSVSITNSDPLIIKVAYDVMKPLTNKLPFFQVQVHLDNDLEKVTQFWGDLLSIEPSDIKIYTRKTSMTTRNGRLPHGIFSIKYSDTLFRSRIQAWIDCVKNEWSGR